MVGEEYVKLCDKEPKAIIDYVTQDMLQVLVETHSKIQLLEKVAEWRYILMIANGKIK